MALLATLVIFLIANTVPGDPVLAQLGDIAASNKAVVAEWRAKYGLDLPLWQRYLIFLQRPARTAISGISIASQRPVLADIAQFAPATLELATVGLPACARHRHPARHPGGGAARQLDRSPGAACVSLIGVSSPTFWLAFIVLAVFYGGLQIAPGPGRLDPIAFPPTTVTGLYLIDTRHRRRLGDVPRRRRPSRAALDRARRRDARPDHAHDAREHARDACGQDYVRVARAKGLRERTIVRGHVLPNALIPVVTLGGLAYANLLTGAVMTETIFSWPGLGRYTFRSAAALDFPAIMGITARRRARLPRDQLPDRHQLRPARSAGGAMTALVDSHSTAPAIAPVARRGAALAPPLRARGARRGDHPGLDPVALFAPLLTPYHPDVVDVTVAPAAAVAGALARHRRARPRRAHPPPLRRAHLAHDRHRRRARRRGRSARCSAASRPMRAAGSRS